MSEALDIDQLKTAFLGRVFDEQAFVLRAEDIAQYARTCGEQAPRFTDRSDPDFQAPPTMATSLQPAKRMPDGFPKIAGLGMDAGKACAVMKPIRPDVPLTGKSHMHDIYTKTGRSGRMVFFVIRMDLYDADGDHLAWADTSVVIRERPES
jgi:hypothetical protein